MRCRLRVRVIISSSVVFAPTCCGLFDRRSENRVRRPMLLQQSSPRRGDVRAVRATRPIAYPCRSILFLFFVYRYFTVYVLSANRRFENFRIVEKEKINIPVFTREENLEMLRIGAKTLSIRNSFPVCGIHCCSFHSRRSRIRVGDKNTN